jgi:hypothetical protein
MGARAIRDADMATAHSLIEEIRRELDPVEEEIRRHPYLAALEYQGNTTIVSGNVIRKKAAP